MLKVTLRGIRQHMVRFLLTAFAVTLGVALVAGTFVLTDSIDKTFESIVDAGSQGVDVEVRGRASDNKTFDDTVIRQGLPLRLRSTLARVPGVARVSPDLQGQAVLVGRDGTPVRNGGAPGLGFAYDPDGPALQVVQGRGPADAAEVAVEQSTLEKSGLNVGDTTTALIGQTSRRVTIVGKVRFGAGLGGATLLLVDPATAVREFAGDGTVQSFAVAADAGVGQATLRARVAAAVPTAEVITGKRYRQEQNDSFTSSIGFINTFLLAFAGVSLFVGAFIIANTFSMLVAQRTRELALLRALGASRGQVLRVVLGEAFVLGLGGSLAGLGVGLLLAQALQALIGSFGLRISGGLPVQSRTIAVSVLVGVVVTLVSAVLPAVRASRVAPVAALRDDIAAPAGGLLRRGLIGAVVLVAGAALVVPTVLSDDVTWWLVGVGAGLLVIGALVAAPVTTRPVVRVVAKPFTLRGAVGRLARENALRNPRRTATTASALMIGLALMAGFSILAASTKASVGDLVETQLKADYVLNGGQAQFPPTVAGAVRTVPGVASVANVNFVAGSIDGRSAGGVAADPAALVANVRVKVISGTLSGSNPRDVFVSRSFAEDAGLRVGSSVRADVGSLKGQQLRVRGVFADNNVIGAQAIYSPQLYDRAVPRSLQGDFALYVKARDGVDPATLRSPLAAAVKPFVVVSVQDAEEFTSSQADQINVVLSLLYALLALSVVIAVLGIVNTLALSVFERTREIGLLRAVGLTRPQLRRMITVESVSTAVFGAVLGLALGLAFGLIVQRGLRSEGLESLAIPWGTLASVLLAAAVAGVVAAALPAWRATRLDVLRAITTD